MDRRELIKALGAACGGVFLSACGGGGSGVPEVPGLPNAAIPPNYRFTSLLKSNQVMSGMSQAVTFAGSSALNNRGQIAFLGRDPQKKTALYLGAVNFQELSARTEAQNAQDVSLLSGTQRLLAPQDRLPDGAVAAKVESFCLSESGSVFMRVMNTRGEHAIYVKPLQASLQRVVGPGDALPGGGGKFAHCMGDFEAHDDDSLVLVSHFLGDRHHGQGIFVLPQGRVAGGRRMASTLDTLPNSTDKIAMFGLLDTNGVDCAHQVFTQVPAVTGTSRARGTALAPPNALLVASLVQDTMMVSRINAVSQAVNLPTSLRSTARSGETHHGPRINRIGQVAGITTEGQIQELHIAGKLVLSSGQLSPTGRRMGGFLGPVPGVSDQFFIVTQLEDGGSEILLTNGVQTRSVAFDGQKIGNFAVSQYGLGGTRNQVDSTGRFVCAVSYADRRTGLVAAFPANA